ncbi:MAG: GGDEF domain-containing protein [Colwellia sp.]|nr:GGDEF domain-containing protein [Colwellia sp.]
MAHPKLIEVLVQQTPRAMIAMLIVSAAYFWVFAIFIPLIILVFWFFFQILLAAYRLYNAKMFEKHLKQNDQVEIQKQERFFLISNLFQAFMWTMSSVLAAMYAPQPYELVSFVIIIGVITAAALSMSTIYSAYLVFFFAMIIPQIIILLYYGEHQHIGLVGFVFIYIPATILLSKALYSTRLSSIRDNCKLEESVKELHKLSMIDNLTNIYNRRYFFKMSQDIISLAKREEKKVSLLMIDIDHFKNINDTYGHQGGDSILINLVKEIEKVMRKSDVFARIGGEEFAVLLHNASVEGAIVIAEKIRATIENKTFIYNTTTINLTISIGIAELNKNNTTIETLYTQADKQLYFAKNNGKNRVVS